MSVTGFTFLHKVQTRNTYTSGGNYRLSETVQAMLKYTKLSGQYKKKKMLSVTADNVIYNEVTSTCVVSVEKCVIMIFLIIVSFLISVAETSYK